VLYPHLWAYKMDDAYYCSWHCLRAEQKRIEKGETPMAKTNNNTDRRDRIEVAQQLLDAMSGGTDPIEFLRAIGYAMPMQSYQDIKKTCKETNPKLFNRFPKDLRAWRKEHGGMAGAPAALPKEVETPEGEFTAEVPEVHTIENAEKMVNEYFRPAKTVKAKDIMKVIDGDTINSEGVFVHEKKPANYDGFGLVEIRGTFGTYSWKSGYFAFDPVQYGVPLEYNVDEWRVFMNEIRHAAEVLGVEL